jgi:hypothetical protein
MQITVCAAVAVVAAVVAGPAATADTGDVQPLTRDPAVFRPQEYRVDKPNAGTLRQGGASKLVWMATNAKPYEMKDSTPTIPRSSRR